MLATVPLGKLLGIPVGLHYSWFLIAALLTLSAAAQFGMHADLPDKDFIR